MEIRYTANKDVAGLSAEKKRQLLIARCFAYLQDAEPAIKRDEESGGESAASDQFDSQLIRHPESDSALQLAAQLYDELPELSDRAALTRYLLYLLQPKSRLYGNEMALLDTERLIGAGVMPFAFQDILSVVQESVHAAVADFKDATKYL